MGWCQLYAVSPPKAYNKGKTSGLIVSFNSVGKEGSAHQEWERATWPALKEITEKYPEAGIHFRGM
jgi:hypothetical protein